MKKRNILAENMRRFGTKNLMPLHESALSNDDILDIILTYTKDPDAAEAALANYRETGDFGDASIESNVTRDPRWTDSDEEAGIKDGDDEILFRDFTKGDEKFANDQEKALSNDKITYFFYHTYPSMEEAKADGKEGYVYLERNGKIFSFFPELK